MSKAVPTTGILVRRGSGTAGTGKAVTSSSVASPTVITSPNHGFYTGQTVNIAGHTGSTPALTGPYVVTVLSPNTFTVPVNVTVGGTGGTATATDSFDTIGEIVSVTPPGFSRDKLPTSTHNDGVASSVLGMLNQKDPAFRINFVASEATHIDIVQDIMQNRQKTWRIDFPSGLVFYGVAGVSNFELADAPMNAIQQADVALAWAGAVTMLVPETP